MADQHRVLIVDPDPDTAGFFREAFQRRPFRFVTVGDLDSAREAILDHDLDAVVCEIDLDGDDGLVFLRETKKALPHLPVLITTDEYDSRTAIEVVKAGAFDFVPKPIDQRDIEKSLTEAVNCSRKTQDLVEINPKNQGTDSADTLVGNSRAMMSVYKTLGRLSPTPVTVLIHGETGTGKELIARALHQHGHRAHKPFITVNCAAIPENLLESELFGHEKGAFTGATSTRIGKFEQANGATLFLDEIGDLDMGLQAKLLRVLQEKQFQRVGGNDDISVDVRIIAATHKPLEKMIADGEFREDLFYRLNVASIELPPLRDREGDIPLLSGFFLKRSCEELGLPQVAMTRSALELLSQSGLPGNVRQLQNLMRKAVLNARGFTIDKHLIEDLLSGNGGPELSEESDKLNLHTLCAKLLHEAAGDEKGNAHQQMLETIEPVLFQEAMKQCDGNLSHAATLLGLSRLTLREKLKAYGFR